MVQGIETDSKKLSKIKKRDEKWLTKDLQDIKTTVEHYIDEVRPDSEKDEDYIVKTPKSKVFNYVIIFLHIPKAAGTTLRKILGRRYYNRQI